MYWELYQQSVIRQAQSAADRASSRSDQVEIQLRQLESKVNSLALACQSLWEIVQEHTDINRDQLIAKMEEIDLRDGVKDGRITPKAKPCSKCGRQTSKRRPKCIYCGTEIEVSGVFGMR